MQFVVRDNNNERGNSDLLGLSLKRANRISTLLNIVLCSCVYVHEIMECWPIHLRRNTHFSSMFVFLFSKRDFNIFSASFYNLILSTLSALFVRFSAQKGILLSILFAYFWYLHWAGNSIDLFLSNLALSYREDWTGLFPTFLSLILVSLCLLNKITLSCTCLIAKRKRLQFTNNPNQIKMCSVNCSAYSFIIHNNFL